MADSIPRHRDERGFTLVELLVVILITAVVGSGIVAAVVSAAGAERRALDLRNNTDSARLAVERIRDTVRTSFGVCDGSSATQATLWLGDTFDVNDRVDEEELVAFSFVDGQLLRADGVQVARGVAFGVGDGSSFEYIDRVGAIATLPVDIGIDCAATEPIVGRGDVASIDVTLSGDRAPDGRTSATVSSTRLSLRNAAISDGTINPNRPPTVSFTQSCSGTECTFDASESFDEDGEIVSYAWDFGDGIGTASGVATTYTYIATGGYDVKLTVVDDGGVSASMTQFVGANLEENDDGTSTGNAAPSAAFVVSCAGLTCSFDASGSFDSDGSIASYNWDFGEAGASGTGVTSTHTYAVPNSYPVSLAVIDNAGAEGTETKSVVATQTSTQLEVTGLEDTSVAVQGNKWTPRVRITLRYADGAPAAGIRINGRFGPENSTDLKSGETNAQGNVELQSNGTLNNSISSYAFSVLSVDGSYSLSSDNRSVTLLKP